MHKFFVALMISEELREEIAAWQEKFSNLPVRWIIGKNLHITLVPPWFADNLEEVIDKLKVVRGKSADIALSAVEYGPDKNEPRLIWASGKPAREIFDLKAALEKVLGRSSDREPWLMHLTLARFRSEDFAQFPIKKIDEPVNWRMTARSFALLESLPTATGTDYKILKEFPL